MEHRTSFKLVLFVLVLSLAALACNLPGAALPSDDDAVVATGIALTLTAGGEVTEAPAATEDVATDAPTATLQPTNTTAPTATEQACNVVSFVSDVTIPDGTDFGLNDPFTKTWRLRNDGGCTWDNNYKLVFKAGDQMNGPDVKPLNLGSITPGQTFDVSVNLVSPNSPGSYQGFWRLQSSDGQYFELSTGPFWVQIDVEGAELPEWPVYRQGDSGDYEIYAIQYLLRYHGSGIAADGAYGVNTRNAVVAFQNDRGLTADGVVGPQTWAELVKNVVMQQGLNGDAVRAIQILLNYKYSYVSVTVDGAFGAITRQGVESFQNSVGLEVDGIVGPNTWQYLVGANP